MVDIFLGSQDFMHGKKGSEFKKETKARQSSELFGQVWTSTLGFSWPAIACVDR